MAAGMIKQLAILCWNPTATKIMIGNQIPKIFPAASLAPKDNQTANPTNQLQPIPEIKADQKLASVLALAILITACWKGCACVNPTT